LPAPVTPPPFSAQPISQPALAPQQAAPISASPQPIAAPVGSPTQAPVASPSAASSQTTSPLNSGTDATSGANNTGAIVGGVIGAIAAVGIAILLAILFIRRRKKSTKRKPEHQDTKPAAAQNQTYGPMETTMETVHDKETQTSDWNIDPTEIELGKVIGQGSFGFVHRGSWRGADVAVKVTQAKDKQAIADFLREAELMKYANFPRLVVRILRLTFALVFAETFARTRTFANFLE
jgi:hypothetical protein